MKTFFKIILLLFSVSLFAQNTTVDTLRARGKVESVRYYKGSDSLMDAPEVLVAISDSADQLRSEISDSIDSRSYDIFVPFTGAHQYIDFNGKALKNFFISKTADTTAKLAFDVSALSTGTTRTFSFPDASGAIDVVRSSNTAGQFYTGTTDPTSLTRRNFGGSLYMTRGFAPLFQADTFQTPTGVSGEVTRIRNGSLYFNTDASTGTAAGTYYHNGFNLADGKITFDQNDATTPFRLNSKSIAATDTVISIQNAGVNKFSILGNGDASVKGDFTYDFRHTIGGVNNTFVSGSTHNVKYKIDGINIVWAESDGMTSAGDSVRLLKTGHYEVWIWPNATTSNASDFIRFYLFKNNADYSLTSNRRIAKSFGAGAYITNCFFWYVEATANDYLSFHVANISAARAVTIEDMQVYVKWIPEN